MRYESDCAFIKRHKAELIVLVIYTILHIVLRTFHEGCFDEVHAWNIAKDANGDLLRPLLRS